MSRTYLTRFLFLLVLLSILNKTDATNIDTLRFDSFNLSIKKKIQAEKYQEAFEETKKLYEYGIESKSEDWIAYSVIISAQLYTIHFIHLKDSSIYNLRVRFDSLIDSIFNSDYKNLSMRSFDALDTYYGTLWTISDHKRSLQLLHYKKQLIDYIGIENVKLRTDLLNDFGVTYGKLGQYDKKLTYHKKALEVLDKNKIGLTEERIHAYNSLASVYFNSDEYERAGIYLKKIISQIEHDSSKIYDYMLPMLYANIGICLMDFNKEEAKQYLEKTKSIYEETNEKSPTALNWIYTALGDMSYALNDSTSIQYFEIARKHIQKFKSYEYQKVSLQLKTTLSKAKFRNKYNEGIEEVKRLISYAEENKIEQFTYQSNPFRTISYFFFLLEEYDSCLYYGFQSLYHLGIQNLDSYNNFKQIIDHESYHKQIVLQAKANYKLWLKRQDTSYFIEAKKWCELALEHLNHLRRSHYYLRTKLFDYNLSYSVHELGILLEMEDPDSLERKNWQDAFQFFESSKAFVLGQALNDKRVKHVGKIPDSILNLESSLRKKSGHIQTSIRKAKSQNDSTNLLKLKKEYHQSQFDLDSLMELMRESYPDYYELTRLYKSIAFDSIRTKVLKKNTALISYFLGKDRLYVFSSTVSKTRLDTITYDDLAKSRIKQFYQLLSNPESSDKQTYNSIWLYKHIAHQVYNDLFPSGTQELIADAEKLIIIPDGILNYIPFEALLVDTSRKNKNITDFKNLSYLLYEYEVSYAYSATLLNQQLKKKPKELSYLGIAPHYNTKQMKHLETLSPFRNFRESPIPLVGNLEEVEQSAKILDGEFLKGEEANEEHFKQKVNNFNVLHFAMHGLMDETRPMNSQLLFSTSADSVDDGSLFAYELYGLPMNADLVVMSACNSANGKLEKGEGIMSMARAFSYEACPSVVSSLWLVDDYSAKDIIIQFFKEINEGKSKSEALREAKLHYLSSSSPERCHPFYWSNMILLGNDKPLVKKNNWIYIITSLVVLIIISSIIIKNRKSTIPN